MCARKKVLHRQTNVPCYKYLHAYFHNHLIGAACPIDSEWTVAGCKATHDDSEEITPVTFSDSTHGNSVWFIFIVLMTALFLVLIIISTLVCYHFYTGKNNRMKLRAHSKLRWKQTCNVVGVQELVPS